MVLVQTAEGWLRGVYENNDYGPGFYSFRGIPYAEAPIGPLRFKAPQPVKPWSDVKNATKEGNESVSRYMFGREMIGDEDCLNLNIYTPALSKNTAKLKPVMFWIHGGAFVTGSSKSELYGPHFLMAEDVVLVTINYRLGVLGFLSLENRSLGVPGNAAFKDMVLALKWVRRNVANFCGDPENVTVFGESAGASSAHLLMLSPMAKGLFHKVIAQSGSALNHWIYGRRCARLVANQLGFCSFDERKIIEFLRTAPARDILRAQKKLEEENFLETDYRCVGVVIEKETAEEDAFLSQLPIEIIDSGCYNHVPLLMGYNHNEGMAFDSFVAHKKDKFFYDMEMSVPLTLNVARDSELSKKLARNIQSFYFNTEKQHRDTHTDNYILLCTDSTFLRDIYFSVKAHLRTLHKPIYFYRLSLDTDLNLFKKLAQMESAGVYHGDDIGYIFHTHFTPHIEPESVEDLARRKIVRMWANFAKFGDPTPDSSDELLHIKWESVRKDRFNYLDIANKELKMLVNPEPERMGFWHNMFKIHPAISKL